LVFVDENMQLVPGALPPIVSGRSVPFLGGEGVLGREHDGHAGVLRDDGAPPEGPTPEQIHVIGQKRRYDKLVRKRKAQTGPLEVNSVACV
jgi:hypothetical protein